MKIWILGKTGLLGKALASYCLSNRIDFTVTGRQEADIADLFSMEKAFKEIHPTHIVNCTAFNDVDGAEKRGVMAYAVNAMGAENLGMIAEQNKVKAVHISTDYVFDGEKNTPYLEEDECAPLNVYGKSKREGEVRLLKVNPSALIIRTSWLFGEGGKNFISKLLNILKSQTEIKTPFDQVGSPTFAKDLARDIVGNLNKTGLYHFANTGGCSRVEIAEYFLKLAKEQNIPVLCKSIVPISSEEVGFVAKRPNYSVLNVSKIFVPRPWKEAVKDYVNSIS